MASNQYLRGFPRVCRYAKTPDPDPVRLTNCTLLQMIDNPRFCPRYFVCAFSSSLSKRSLVIRTFGRDASTQNDFPDVPVVWQTTAEFINFKYDFMVPRDQEIYQRAVSIDCSHGGETAFRGGILEFKNCALDLNQHIAGGSGLRELSFVNCLIRYTGGSVPAVPMTLRDCIFRFDVPRIPPTSGKRMMQILAAEDTTTVQIPASSETPS